VINETVFADAKRETLIDVSVLFVRLNDFNVFPPRLVSIGSFTN